MSGRMQDKVVVITGGAAGIGDTCGPDVACTDGLCSDGLCVSDTAPTITDGSGVQIDSGSVVSVLSRGPATDTVRLPAEL